MTSPRFKVMGGSSLLNSCQANTERGLGAPFDYEDLSSRVRNVTFPMLLEKNILEDTKEVPFYTYYQNGMGVFEETVEMLDLRAAITAYSGLMTEYNTYNYSLTIVPEILSTPKRDPSTFRIEHQARRVNLEGIIPQLTKSAIDFFDYLKRIAQIKR